MSESEARAFGREASIGVARMRTLHVDEVKRWNERT